MSKHLTQFKNQHLKSDEHIIANIKANAGKAMGRGQNKQINNGELILTNNELVFYKKGLTGETKNSIPLQNISSTNTNSSMLAFNFVISSFGNDFHFNSTDKKAASNFESKLNSALNGTPESVASSSNQVPHKKGNKLKYGLAIFVVLMIIGALFDEPKTTKTAQKNESTQTEQPKQQDEKSWYNKAEPIVDENAIAWQNASNDTKVATAAEIAARIWTQKKFTPEIQNKIKTIDDLKPITEHLVQSLNTAFEKQDNAKENTSMYTNQKILDTSVMLLSMDKIM